MALIQLTPRLTKAARSLLGWGQGELAKRSGVSTSTIGAFEAKTEAGSLTTMNNRALFETFEAGGVEFIPENGGGAGVRLRKPSRKPQPAADDDEPVSILEWPAGKPLPRNYRDGSNDLLNDEDRVSNEQMDGMRQDRLARQDAEAAAKAAAKPKRTRAKKQP